MLSRRVQFLSLLCWELFTIATGPHDISIISPDDLTVVLEVVSSQNPH